ncbi:hypothetical protein [Pseudoalteromonas phage J2-1_QLiu-2017]|nr:hypothetical protein [Pseudoalteromonas phage J2-1_QLiu-2017]
MQHNRRYSLIVSDGTNRAFAATATQENNVVRDDNPYQGLLSRDLMDTEDSFIGILEKQEKSVVDYLVDDRRESLIATEITESDMNTSITGSVANGTSDKADFEILNLSQKTRDAVEKVGSYVILKAGYYGQEKLDLVFAGQISSVSSYRKGKNLVTKLSCSSGYKPNNAIRVAKRYAAGTNYQTIIEDLVSIYNQAGIATGRLEFPDEELGNYVETYNYQQLKTAHKKPLERGFTVMGYLEDVLKKVCESIGYTFYMVKSTIYIHPKRSRKTVEQYSFETKNIYSLTSKATSATNPSTQGGIDVGLTMVIPLDARLDQTKQIRIDDGEHKGEYRINKVKHDLDYRGPKWHTTLSLVRIDEPEEKTSETTEERRDTLAQMREDLNRIIKGV